MARGLGYWKRGWLSAQPVQVQPAGADHKAENIPDGRGCGDRPAHTGEGTCPGLHGKPVTGSCLPLELSGPQSLGMGAGVGSSSPEIG